MIVSKKSSIVAFVFLCSILFFLFALKSYSVVLTLSSATEAELKIIAEKIFFWGIIGSSFIIAAGLRIIIKSFMFEKSLDKLLVMSQTYGYSTAAGLKKLGNLGKKLSVIFFEINSLSERKSKKISSLNRLITLVFSFIEKKILIVSVTGEILFASESALKGVNKDIKIVNQHLTDFFPDLKFSSEVDGIIANRAVKKIESINADVYPVFNNINDLDFLVFVFDEHVSLNIIPASINIINSMTSNNRNIIKKISKNIFRKEKK